MKKEKILFYFSLFTPTEAVPFNTNGLNKILQPVLKVYTDDFGKDYKVIKYFLIRKCTKNDFESI